MNMRSIAFPSLCRHWPTGGVAKKLSLVFAGLFVFARLGLGGFTLTDTIDLLPGPDAYAPQWEGLNHNTHRLYALGSYAMGFQDFAVQVVDTTTGEVVTGIDLGTKINNGVVSPVQPYGFAVDEGTTPGGNSAYALIQLGPNQFAVRPISGDAIVPNSDVILTAFTSYDSLAVNSVTHRVYAVDENGEVTVIDGPGHSIVTSVNSFVGSGPHVVVVNPNSNNVLLFGSNGAALIDGFSGVTPVTLPANFSAKAGAYNSSNNRFYVFAVKGNSSGVADYGVFVFDAGGTLVSSKTGFDSNIAAVAIDPATSSVFLGAPNFAGSITTVNAGDLSTKGTFNIGASALAFDAGSLFLVDFHGGESSARLRNAVGILNTSTGALTHKTVGYAPNCVAVNKATNRIYVADEKAADLEVINGADHTVLARIPLEPIVAEANYFPEVSLPRHVAVSETLNRIYLTRARLESDSSYTQVLDVIDGSNNQLIQTVSVATSAIGYSGPIAVDDTHRRIFVLAFAFQNHPLVELNADTNAIINTQALGPNTTDVAVNSVTGRVYVSGRDNNGNGIVQILDGASLNVVATASAGALPGPMAVNTKTNKIYVANTGAGSVDNSVTVINGATDSFEATFKNTSQNNGDAVTNVAVDEATNTIFVADNSNGFDARGRVTLFNGSNNSFQKQVDVGRYPVALAFNSTTKELFVTNNEEGTVSVLGTGVAIAPTPPPHGGLSATKFTVNGSSSPVYPPTAPPVTNLADTIMVFAAQQTGTPAGLVVRVQASTTPGIESSWSNLANASNGGTTYDITTSQFVLSSNDYPPQNGVYFRATASAQGYPDSNSNIVGPFNLASNKSRIASTALHFTGNGPIADLYFRAIESATPPGLAVRVQTTTTPTDEATWSDLSSGHAGAMTQSIDPSQFLLLVNNYPATTGIYFRAVASASGFVDSISNLVGPYDVTQSVPPVVSITPPAGLPNGGNGASPDSPILVRSGTFSVSADAQTNRAVKKLALQVDGQTKFELNDGSKHLDYTLGGIPLGDHVLEAVAVDDQGARARAGTAVTYIRVVPGPSTIKAERSAGSGTGATDSAGNIYSIANSGGSWDDPATWIDAAGNHGIPGPDDFAVIGSASVKFGVDRTVKSLSINGGHLLGPGIVNILGIMTFTAGTVEDNVGIIIQPGAVLQLNNSTDLQFNPGSTGRGHIYNAGTCNIHGSAGIIGAGDITNHGTINWLPAIQIPLNASIDPNAALRSLQANTFTNGGIISGNLTHLIGSDSAGLISEHGAGLIGSDSASLVAAGGGNIIGSNSAGIISSNSAGIISSNSAGVVSAGGGNCIAAGGGNFHALANARADSGSAGFTQSGGEINLNAFNVIGPVTLNGGTLTGSGFIQGDLTNNGGYILPGHSGGAIGVLGNFTQGADGTLIIENGGPSPFQFEQLLVSGAANLDGKLDVRLINGYTPDPADTFSPLGYSSVSGSFTSVSSNAQVMVTSTGVLTAVNPNVSGPSTGQPLNIATRLAIQGGDNVLIAGFIVTGPSGSTKKVLIRGLGPSLANAGISDAIQDPLLELHEPDGAVIVNDNWQQGDTSQIPNGFAPGDSRESVIVATLTPGTYTAVVKGAHGETGVGLAEIYDLESGSTAKLANIATRGFVQTGDNVLIGGFIIGGGEPTKVLVRAIGPSLAAFGVPNTLPATTLEVHDANGNAISNDGWRSTQESDIIATTIPPSNDNEAAILATLVPGTYTAVVRGKNDTTGIAVIEAYNLQ